MFCTRTMSRIDQVRMAAKATCVIAAIGTNGAKTTRTCWVPNWLPRRTIASAISVRNVSRATQITSPTTIGGTKAATTRRSSLRADSRLTVGISLRTP